MAANKSDEKEARAARGRLRVYNARQAVHANKISRRRRDNIFATIVALVVITLATATQFAYFTDGPGASAPESEATESEATASADPEAQSNVGDVPSPDFAENRVWSGELAINDVPLAIELDGAAAPQAVAAFVQESREDYFPGKTCHRLTTDGFYVLQCGSVDGVGGGDPTFSFGPIENAPVDDFYAAGTIAMARASGDAYSNGRQFFIVYEDTTIASDQAGGYTVMGRVTGGLEALKAAVVDAGVAGGATDGAPVTETTITSVTLD